MPTDVYNLADFNKYINKDKLVVVDFYATCKKNKNTFRNSLDINFILIIYFYIDYRVWSMQTNSTLYRRVKQKIPRGRIYKSRIRRSSIQ